MKTAHPLILSILTLCLLINSGCGFHLRGAYNIPADLQTIQLSPHEPYNDFQRTLRKILHANHIQVMDKATKNRVTLVIVKQTFIERTVSYGTDGQPNRAILELQLDYRLEKNSNPISSLIAIRVERELTIDPNHFLATNNERKRLEHDLYQSAASQLVRQLSTITRLDT